VGRSLPAQLTGHDDDEVELEALKQDPAHDAEIESLLELTNSNRRSRSNSRTTPTAPNICSDRLKSKEIDVTMEGYDRQV